MDIFSTIASLSAAMEEELIAQRRDFHKYPELCWQEMRTTSIIARHLSNLG